MLNCDTLALRIEWNGFGPFWCERTRRLLERLCRQATPEWKQQEGCATFLERYITTGPCPYDNRQFDWHLSRLAEGDATLAFGFVSRAVLFEQFELDNELFRRQFQALLARPEFAVRAYLVKPLAQSAHEVLYRRTQAELVEEVHNWGALVAL